MLMLSPAYGDWSFLAASPLLADLEKLNVASSAACWLHPIIASHCFTQSSYNLLVQTASTTAPGRLFTYWSAVLHKVA